MKSVSRLHESEARSAGGIRVSHRCLRLKPISNDRRIADHVFLVVGTVLIIVYTEMKAEQLP